MRIDVLTLFPTMFTEGPLSESIIKRAQGDNLIELHTHDLRDYGLGNYNQVDDEPYGGGAGMVFRADVVVPALEAVASNGKWKMENGKLAQPYSIYLSPRGERLNQPKVETMAADNQWLILLCGHYEGIDQRIIDGWIDEEVSIGDYVLTGGELPAMVLIDAVARHIPGVLGHENSAHEESFSAALGGKKEYPHYTRPETYRDMAVPEILLSGHHAKIEEWRQENCIE